MSSDQFELWEPVRRRDLQSRGLPVVARSTFLRVVSVPHFIRLRDSTSLDLEDPDYSAVCVTNIVHGLAGAFRFGCQSPRRVTVAEHTCMGARLLAHPELAITLAEACSLHRLAAGLRADAPSLCRQLSDAFLTHDFPEAFLHDLTSPFKQMDALAGYRRVEAMHMERVAARFKVPYVAVGRRLAAEYETAYQAAWARKVERNKHFWPPDLAIPSTAEQEAHLLTMEVWAAVHWIDSALGKIEMEQAWSSVPVEHTFFDLAIAAVRYEFLTPDDAYNALAEALPAPWRTRS